MCSRSSDSNCLLIYLQKIIYAPTVAVGSVFSFLIYTPGVLFLSTSRKYPPDLDPKVKYAKLCNTLMSPYLNCSAPFWKGALLHSQVSYCVQGMLVNRKRVFLYWYKNAIRLFWQSTPSVDTSGKAVPVLENLFPQTKRVLPVEVWVCHCKWDYTRSDWLRVELAQGRVGASSYLPQS